MRTNRIKKTRKTPSAIVELAELVPLRKIKTDWIVDFADDPDRVIDPASLAEILCMLKFASVTVVIHTRKPNLLAALLERSRELRARGSSRLRSHVMADRFIVDHCGPSDVLALAKVVAKIEGRELAGLLPLVGASGGS